MAYRLIRPSRGWVRVLWNRGQRHPLDVELALSNAQLIPGVGIGEGYAEFPLTTWGLASVHRALDLMGVGALLPTTTRDLAGGVRLWEPQEPLYGFQKSGASALLTQRGFLLADDMGLGKSAQAIVAAETVRALRGHRPGIIVAPLFVRDSWRNELLRLGAIKDPSEFCALESRNLDDGSFRSLGVEWYFVHYAVVRAWWSKITLDAASTPVVSILDEAHYIRNSRTDRAKGALMVASRCDLRMLLTGTPVDNRPSDLWNLLTVATGARTWGGPLEFRRRYAGAYHDGYGYRDGDAPTNVEELRQRIAPFYLRRTADHVKLELPAMTRAVQYVDLDQGRQREHDDVLGTASVDAIVRAVASGGVREVLPVLTRLRQVTSEAKLRATFDYVSNAFEQGLSACVIFCWERRAALQLAERFGSSAVPVTGDDTQDVRAAKVAAFQQYGGILVATYGALAEGVTLHRSRLVVLHDLDYVLSKMLQAEKRIHRVGQRRACQSVWMVANNSIDSLLLPLLFDKAQLSNELLDIGEGASAFEELKLVPDNRIDDEVQRVLHLWEGTA